MYYRYLLFSLFFSVFALLQPTTGLAGHALKEQETPAALEEAITHLLGLVGEHPSKTFLPEKLAAMVDFIESGKQNNTLYYPRERLSTTTAYYEFRLDADLDRLLGYAYNPAIPPQALSPSSLRTAYLLPNNEGRTAQWRWQLPADPESPQVVSFGEHEEVTPDLFTGAYYGYDVDRTLILCRLNGKNVFVSLARQRDTSDVGKKGAALGSRENWDFLYSDQPGLNTTGLGWVKSYMYKAFSISIFVEDEARSGLHCATFKWLNAGWAGVNMVKRKHIHRGLERYVTDLKKIIENRNLPDSEKLAAGFAALRQMSLDELKDYLYEYCVALAKEYGDSKPLSHKIFADLIHNNTYLEGLSLAQMRAIVELEYFKAILGKPSKLPGLTGRLTRFAAISGR